jgi:hypothetical protein
MAAKTNMPPVSASVSQADLMRFKRDFTRLSVEFPRESGRAAKSLGNFVMRGMRTGLKAGKTRSELVAFSGSWPQHNKLYKLLQRLGTGKELAGFGGKLAGGKGGKGSPIGYFFDSQGMSISVGMFRSVPGMRNAKAKQGGPGVDVSASAADSFLKFQKGGSKGPYDAKARQAVYLSIARAGGTKADIALARREMHRPWVTPERNMVDPMARANMGKWMEFLRNRVKWILENKGGGK